MKTTILIPVLNIEDSVEDVLGKMKRVCDEILIVCDITRPEMEKKTIQWLDGLKKKYRIRYLCRTKERGYGSAVKFGFSHASGDVIVVMTADKSDEPHVVPKMVESVSNGADVVCGTRFSKGGGIIGNIFKEKIARNISLFLRIFSKTGTYDATNGFRAYRASAARSIDAEENSFSFNLEFLVKAAECGYKIDEVPTVWSNRVSGKPNFHIKKEGKEYAHWAFYAISRMPSLATKTFFILLAVLAVMLAVS